MPPFQDAIRKAIQLHQAGRLSEAIAIYENLLSQRPDDAGLLFLLGGTLQEAERLDEALANYDRALALRPDLAEGWSNRGRVLQHLKRREEALESFDQALRINPHAAEAFNDRGVLLQELERPNEALASYDGALAIQPQFAEGHYNRGHVLKALRRQEEALASFGQAVRCDPGLAKAWSNRGVVLQDLQRLEEALASFEAALKIDPFSAETQWNKALTLLMAGRYEEGWALYEWRLKKEGAASKYPTHGRPVWRGEDISGKRLLVTAEQGLGDTIQFCRYLPLVEAAQIIFEAPENLLSFVASLDCSFTPVAKGAALPVFDAVCPLMSLPHVFKTGLETIPAQRPYLHADPNKVAQWEKMLGPRQGLRVGLAWSGRQEHRADAFRSIRLEELLGLGQLPVSFHSLQKDYRDPDLELLNRTPWLHQHQQDLQDFSDTAALAQCMDLIISVDTSIAHAAGAIGKPVWIFLPYESDYRWMLDRADSPWYPTAKLYRQDASRSWGAVVERAMSDIKSRTL